MDLSELKQLQCPQTWNFDTFTDIEKELKDKIADEYEEKMDLNLSLANASQLSWYCCHVLLSYEAYRKENYEEALQHLTNCVDMDDFMMTYATVFTHVAEASRAHILYKQNSFESANEIVKKLIEEEYSESENAAFKFIHCTFLRSYRENYKLAIELINSALDTDDNVAEYHFTKGILLGRINKSVSGIRDSSEQELEGEALRRAQTLRPDVTKYSIHLANYYMNTMHHLSHQNKHQLRIQAGHIYRDLLSKAENLSGNDIARCIYYLMKVDSTSDLDEAAELARRKSQSALVHHYVGSYYERKGNLKECLNCFEKASERLTFLTGLTLLMVYRTQGNTIDDNEIKEHIQKWIACYENTSDRDMLTFKLNISAFYLIVKDDIKKAVKYFLEASEYEITEKYIINFCKVYSNYFGTLSYEINRLKEKDDDALRVLTILNSIPTHCLTELKPNWPAKCADELRFLLL